ncbi:ADP-ribosylglycohydrolase family protein [Microbulbifer agarilyticus]|uniref:ADP-ribosylglycohydrolase family protein n=1 Tax=Microbulbifer agarilyticus TaxID=260552 RepID=UPI001C983167|nr:ADP-ribosylglycohydrolase family protein [Microbulbifer agarilyticus]MBY6212807.1 ADP-ribosylglycohydrolase family protein [Microbulbifer agarilyticus]
MNQKTLFPGIHARELKGIQRSKASWSLAMAQNPLFQKIRAATAYTTGILVLVSSISGPSSFAASPAISVTTYGTLPLTRTQYQNKLRGFWLGQSLANWTGLVTEMDKIGGPGPHGVFYTRDDWGKPDQPSIWGQGVPSDLSATIDWVLRRPGEVWGADDDTDIEYIYQHLLDQHQTTVLTPEQIRDGWLTHIYSDENTPFTTADGKAENFLWVSNQRAHDLMREQSLLPPETSEPNHNPHFDMIDAQLTTEIFGLFAPGRPDIALAMAHLPIRTTARENAAWAAEFYVVMHALASGIDSTLPVKPQLFAIAERARQQLPLGSYSADMYDFVQEQYQQKVPWEKVRDRLHKKYQINGEAGYDLSTRNLYCNGCFAAGINFGASLISLFYGEGDYRKTVKLAVLMGWDSDNPAATWGGLLGFIYGHEKLTKWFGPLSDEFDIHRTRGGFANSGKDTFSDMARVGVSIVDRVVKDQLGGSIDTKSDYWHTPYFEENSLFELPEELPEEEPDNQNPETSRNDTQPLTVLSLNVYGHATMPAAATRYAQLVTDHNVDLLAVQEGVDDWQIQGLPTDYRRAEALASALGNCWVRRYQVFANRCRGLEFEHNERFDMTDGPNAVRTGELVVVRRGADRFGLIDVHWDHEGERVRHANSRETNAAATSPHLRGIPLLVVGDFNTACDSATTQALASGTDLSLLYGDGIDCGFARDVKGSGKSIDAAPSDHPGILLKVTALQP